MIHGFEPRSLTARDGSWELASGTAVVDNLIAGVEHFLGPDNPGRPRRRDGTPVAIGCTYRFTSTRIAAALPYLTCIVVDKGAVGDAGCRHLLASDRGIHTATIDQHLLGRRGPDGERPRWDGTEFGVGDAGELEPIRVAGWSDASRGVPAPAVSGRTPLSSLMPNRARPLIHAKVLVLGWRLWDVEVDEGATLDMFEPAVAWMGSANFTEAAARHAELGLWTTDPVLVNELRRFVVDLIVASEPPTSMSATPSPELMMADVPEPDWDDIDD